MAFRPVHPRVRDFNDVPLIELASLAQSFMRETNDHDEVLRRMAGVFEKKLTAPRRERFQQAIERATRSSGVTE